MVKPTLFPLLGASGDEESPNSGGAVARRRGAPASPRPPRTNSSQSGHACSNELSGRAKTPTMVPSSGPAPAPRSLFSTAPPQTAVTTTLVTLAGVSVKPCQTFWFLSATFAILKCTRVNRRGGGMPPSEPVARGTTQTKRNEGKGKRNPLTHAHLDPPHRPTIRRTPRDTTPHTQALTAEVGGHRRVVAHTMRTWV